MCIILVDVNQNVQLGPTLAVYARIEKDPKIYVFVF